MTTTLNSNNRNGSIDLFRIISMLMVIVLHVLGHGGVLWSLKAKSAGWFTYFGLETVCLIAVNCFALTTGFLYVGKKIKIKNLINLYFQVLFFSLIIAIIFFITGKRDFSTKTLLEYALPILSGRYWYFSAYFILFLIMPMLNLILEHLSKRSTYVFLIVATILIGAYAFFGTMYFKKDTFVFENGYSFIWLAVLYLFGGAIKKYEIYKKLRRRWWILAYIASNLLWFGCGFLLSYVNNFKTYPYVTGYNFVFNILSSCLLLIIFASIQIKHNKILAFFAKCSFGVYLFHEHVFMRQTFITDKFSFIKNYNILVGVLAVCLIAVSIYLIGSVVDFIRQMIFKLLRIGKFSELIDNKLSAFCEKRFKDKEEVNVID
ncbi:MAG: acyltransferase family protein [Clostridia bacterium]|nr:acyltransferase family protein [Clostridia bacterium]